MKRCTKCESLKDISEYHKNKRSKDGLTMWCRKCGNEASSKYNRDVSGKVSMSENKECSSYLGVAVAERLFRHLFQDVVRMPNNHPGFDFICAKDKKIDVKSSCIVMRQNDKNSRWTFHINKNQIADYFLILAFNNRLDLEPLHQWLIPGHVLNHLTGAGISPSTISKWDKYKQPIEDAQICCNNIKSASE